jgi:hypothetical protein
VVETSVRLGHMQQHGERIEMQNQVRGRAMAVLSSPY